MSSGKNRSAQERAAELRKFRSDIAKLKAKGLAYTGRDVRSMKPTKHAKSVIRKFSDVLEGKAQVVTVPRGKAKDYEGVYARAGNKVVIPKTGSARETARYNKSLGQIVTTRHLPGGKVTSLRKPSTIEELRAAQKKGYKFSIYLRERTGYQPQVFSDFAEMQRVFGPQGSFRNFENWLEYVNIEQYTKEGETIGPFKPDAAPTAPKRKPAKRKTNAKGRNK